MPRLAALILVPALALLPACTSDLGDTSAVLANIEDQSAYERAFQSARDELRDQGYKLDRVDIDAGVITTQRSGDVRELNDLTSRQRHYVRVTFSPPADEAATAIDGQPATGPVFDRTMRVRVIVERIQRPGWRPSSVDARLTSTAIDPTLDDRGLRPVYAVADSEDRPLASRLRAAIVERMWGNGAPSATTGPERDDASRVNELPSH